jgi:putative transposase
MAHQLSLDEFCQFQSLGGSKALPHSIVQRAQIVMAYEASDTSTALAKQFEVCGSTLGQLRQRHLDQGSRVCITSYVPLDPEPMRTTR